MKELLMSIAAGWIRHLLTTLGGVLIAKGLIDATTATNLETQVAIAAVGVATVAIGLGWSALQKLLNSHIAVVLAKVSPPADPLPAPTVG